jgi:hypothetical protein
MDARQLGRRGGRSKSEAKRAAARRNGKRGGRPGNAELFAREVRKARALLAPRLPQIDPGDLTLILNCLLRPPERRAVFLFWRADGRYVF